MRFISWNVNGIRAALKKGFMEFFNDVDADILAIQETKCQVGQVEIETPGYHQYWNQAVKKGYSGTAIFTKEEPLDVYYGIGVEHHDREGRVITLEFEDFFFVTCYTPNAKRGLERLEDRMDWEDEFREYLLELEKPVVLCGDLNVAHTEIDLKNPKTNTKNAGFTIEERTKMTKLLESGFVDSFRELYPNREGAYSWWSYMNKARERNIGWRIDYFILSAKIKGNIEKAFIMPEIMGSDHCPVGVEIEF